jgi:ATP-dependent RNA helicase DDX23/PRP28
MDETEEDLRFKKDIYDITVSDHWSKKRTAEMTERDWRIFREDNDILIKGGKVINPMRDWIEAPLPPIILDAVRRL